MENALKDRHFYIDEYRQLYDDCLIEAGANDPDDVTSAADVLFEDYAGAEDIVGYYLFWYESDALKTWEQNLLGVKELAGRATDTDKEVTRILKELFSE